MVHYRLYQLDGAGRIVSAEWVEADDDERAREVATGRCGPGGAVELWARNKMIARIEPPARS